MCRAGRAASTDLDFPAPPTDALLVRFTAPVGFCPVRWLPPGRGERAVVGVRLVGGSAGR
jgi:hypothetical protein